uniref:Uncharacterized protein n=1 Tax=Candidozyma auris TaxID=498019 RepID=A0A0L0NS94_CANAR
MAAPIIHNQAQIINDALRPKGSDTNDEAKEPKKEPSDMEAVMKPCISEPGWLKYRRYAFWSKNADMDEMSKPNIKPEIHEILAMKKMLVIFGP